MLTPLPLKGLRVPSHRAEAPVATISGSSSCIRGSSRSRVAAGVVGGRDPERPLREVDLEDGLQPAVGAEPLGLPAHQVHQVGAHDAVGEAGEILDGRGQVNWPPGSFPFEDQGRQVGPGGVECGGQARRTRSDDDHGMD